MTDPNERLNELLSKDDHSSSTSRNSNTWEVPSPSTWHVIQNLDLCQWQVSPNGIFRPAAKTVAKLSWGAYSTGVDDLGPYLKAQSLLSDDIVELPESANITVLNGIQKFWCARERYTQYGLVFKRGVLLWGPPGSGKTVTIHLLAKDLIRKKGIVLFCGHPQIMLTLLEAVRRIEPDRPLIVVMEDIDEIIGSAGEHAILSMLDGENQTDNVVYVATTNYPERLGARIVNRPSRFDERIYVGMPSLAARTAYFSKAVKSSSALNSLIVEEWAAATEGLSIAHLRELIAAVMCLDQPFDEVLKRLRTMHERPRDIDGFSNRKPGFGVVGQSAARA